MLETLAERMDWLRFLDWDLALKYFVPDKVATEEDWKEPEETLSADEEDLEKRILSSPFLEAVVPLEEEEASQALNTLLNRLYEEKKTIKVGHYHVADQPPAVYSVETKKEAFLVAPSHWVVVRVPRDAIGPGVLGRTWVNTGVIEIVDSLVGPEYEEVLQHEFNHLLHPEESETQIRYRTRCMRGQCKYN